jgi:hypothetical protein
MAKRRRKTRTHLKGPNNSAASSTTAPKSFVIRSGKVGRSVGGLVQDVRKVLEPNTAIRLRVSERGTVQMQAGSVERRALLTIEPTSSLSSPPTGAQIEQAA